MTNNFKRNRNSLYASSAAAVLGLLLLTGNASAQSGQSYGIKSEPLSVALKDFALKTGKDVVFDPALAAGKTSPGVAQATSDEAALTELLSGSGLTFTRTASGSFAIAAAPKNVDAASDEAAGSKSREIETVTVVGTNIRGGNVSSPVLAITRDDIAKGGFTSTEQALSVLPENYNGGGANVYGSPSRSNVFSSQIGTSTPSLRGLGDATLTLVDGQRLAPTFGFTGSDISSIPLAAVEKIEILADGASSIYGADAIAGVINVVTRKDFQGLETSVSSAMPTQGGGDRRIYSAVGGQTWSDGNFVGSYTHTDQDPLYTRDRSFSAANGGNTTIISPTHGDAFTLFARQNVNDDLEFHFSGLFNTRRGTSFYTYPTVATQYQSNASTQQFTATAGATYQLSGDWVVDVTGSAAQDQERIKTNKTAAGSQTAVSAVSTLDRSNTIGLNASGVLLDLGTGAIRGAFGGGYRSDGFGNTSPAISATRQEYYFYGEIQLPVVAVDQSRLMLNSLDIDVSGRLDHYSDFGTSTNPKVGATYVPFGGLKIMGSYGTSFRAPTLTDLYTPGVGYLFPATDPRISAGTFVGLFESGGNSSLVPEKSSSWQITVDYRPNFLPGLELSLTHFDYHFKDRIAIPPSSINFFAVPLNNPGLAPYTILSPSATLVQQYAAHNGTFFNFAPTGSTLANVQEILDERFGNLAAYLANGFDVTAKYATPFADGTLSLSGNATFEDITQQIVPGGVFSQVSGQVFYPATERARVGLSWTRSAWTISGFVNHLAGENDTTSVAGASNHISSWTTADFTLAYQDSESSNRFLRGGRISLAALNLFDRDPPIIASTLTASIPGYSALGYDAANASPLGRVITLQLSEQW